MPDDLPNIDADRIRIPDIARLRGATPSTHPPRILLLYGSLRQRSYSRFMTFEAERLLKYFGAETRIFDPRGLPLPDGAGIEHPKVQELRELSLWSEGQVWTSPERHGAMSAVMKAQIDWLPLSIGATRPTQGRTLAVMQLSGGSQSFNAINQMRVLGRWMRMVTIPNQSSVAKAYQEFDDPGPSLLRAKGKRRSFDKAGESSGRDISRQPILQASTKVRTGIGQWTAEATAA